MRILGKRGRGGRSYNIATTSKVVELIVGDFVTSDFESDLIVEQKTDILKRVSVLNNIYLPLQYALLFSRGDDGYKDDMRWCRFKEKTHKSCNKRHKVSIREFFAYRIQQKEIETSTLMFSRRLFQQFLVDDYSLLTLYD